MRLTEQTRYALRVMAYCAHRHPHILRVSEVAEATHLTEYTIFKLLKIATKAGLIMTTRGRSGGIQLGISPELITIGVVVRVFEPRFQKCGPADMFDNFDSTAEDDDILDQNANAVIGRGFNAFISELDTIRLTEMLQGMEPEGAAQADASGDRQVSVRS